MGTTNKLKDTNIGMYIDIYNDLTTEERRIQRERN